MSRHTIQHQHGERESEKGDTESSSLFFLLYSFKGNSLQATDQDSRIPRDYVRYNFVVATHRVRHRGHLTAGAITMYVTSHASFFLSFFSLSL